MVDDSSGDGDDGHRSDRHRADEHGVPVAEPELESILASIDDAVFIFSVEGARGDLYFTFQWNNQAHESITGMTVEEFAGLRPREFLGEEQGAVVAAHYRDCVERRDTTAYEETLEHETGEIRWHTKLTPVVEDDEVVQIIGIARDVTDWTARTKHLEVVDRVFRHNIRNTLTVILGQAWDIEENSEPPVTGAANQIVESSEDLLRTSEKARTITEVIIGDSAAKRVRVGSVTDQVSKEFSERDHEADVSVTAPESACVIASPKLSEAVVELVKNAIDHHDGPSPSVDVVVTADDTSVELSVVDDGPGMPEMERAVLEEGQPPRGLSHGTGLGTWMVYWIAHQSNGTVAVIDREPRGSVVTIRLPRPLED